MTNRKKKGGNHVTPRSTISLPAQWVSVARKLAAKERSPVTWWLIAKIAQAAGDAGINTLGIEKLPSLPWEEHSDPG